MVSVEIVTGQARIPVFRRDQIDMAGRDRIAFQAEFAVAGSAELEAHKGAFSGVFCVTSETACGVDLRDGLRKAWLAKAIDRVAFVGAGVAREALVRADFAKSEVDRMIAKANLVMDLGLNLLPRTAGTWRVTGRTGFPFMIFEEWTMRNRRHVFRRLEGPNSQSERWDRQDHRKPAYPPRLR